MGGGIPVFDAIGGCVDDDADVFVSEVLKDVAHIY